MKKTSSGEIKRGQAITFRIPSDISDYTLRQLQKLKETERRNFSSKIAEFVLQGIGQTSHQEREMISLPLPNKLTKSQRDWLKHAHSEALLGTILYHLLQDPLRATALMASLTSSETVEDLHYEDVILSEAPDPDTLQEDMDKKSFDDFDWELEDEIEEKEHEEEQEEERLDDLLGGFLDQMNR